MNITNEVVTRYIDGLYRPLTSELAELRRQAEADHIPVILRDTERFLVSMLTLIRPRRILEIGRIFFLLFCTGLRRRYENNHSGSRSRDV